MHIFRQNAAFTVSRKCKLTDALHQRALLQCHIFVVALRLGCGNFSFDSTLLKKVRFWKRMDICMCIAESLCSTPETNTTLWINYTPTYLNVLIHTDSEKAMAPHSSTLAWKIPWTEEPGGLQSMGSRRVGNDWSDLAAAAAAYIQIGF